MSKTNGHIDFDLAAKIMALEANSAEQQIWQEWLAESPANREEFEALKAIWEMSESSAIDADVAWEKVSDQIEETPVIQLQPEPASGRPWLKRAAAIAVLFVVAATLWLTIFQKPATIELASVGSPTTHQLEDGSSITLNTGATLSYDKDFNDRGREVTLNGEAFFDVAKNPSKPFVIRANGAQVTVLGTSFIVRSSTSHTQLEVLVETGIVEVKSTQRPEVVAQVEAGEKAELNIAQPAIRVERNEESDHMYWRDKTIKFRRTNLKQVVLVLNNIFHQEMSIDSPNLENCELTATFQNESLENILQIIATTLQLQIEQTDEGIVIKGEGC